MISQYHYGVHRVEKLPYSEMIPKFRTAMEAVVKKVLTRAAPKIMNAFNDADGAKGIYMTG